jgi:hypothetical protein
MMMDLESAIDELYTRCIPGNVRSVADVRREVYNIAEYEPGDSDSARAAHAVLAEMGAVEHLAEMILSGRALDVKKTTVELQFQSRQGGQWHVSKIVPISDPYDEEVLDRTVEDMKTVARERQQLNRMPYRVQVVERTTAFELPWGDRHDAH